VAVGLILHFLGAWFGLKTIVPAIRPLGSLHEGRILGTVSKVATCVSVALMETDHAESLPTPEEARDALTAAQDEEDATVNRPVPGWYFPVVAGIVFSLFALNAIADPSGLVRVLIGVLSLGLAVTVGGLIGKYSFSQPGYKGVRVKWVPTILSGLTALVFPIAAFVLDGIIGPWVWIASGAAFAILLVIAGRAYRQKHRHG